MKIWAHGLLRLHPSEPKRRRDLYRRVYEHQQKAVPSFTSKYNITRLVWFEIYDDPVTAITREKELKKWKRDWKVKLIEGQNPEWKDLYESICN